MVALGREADPATLALLLDVIRETEFGRLIVIGVDAEARTRATTVDLMFTTFDPFGIRHSEAHCTATGRVSASPPTVYETELHTTLEATPERWSLHGRAYKPLGSVILLPDGTASWASLIQSVNEARRLVSDSGRVEVWAGDAAAAEELELFDEAAMVETRESDRLPTIRGFVRPGSFRFPAGIDYTELRRELRAKLGPFQECYEHGLRDTPDLQGTLMLSWLMNAEGEVLIAVPTANTTGDIRLVRCITAAMEQFRFSPLVGASEEPFHWSLNFELDREGQ